MATLHRMFIDRDRRVGMACTALILMAQQGCGGLELNPLVSERRLPRAELDHSKSLSISHELVLDDKRRPAHELRLPAGIYALEGEDEEYWYFRAASPLQMVDFRRGIQTDRHTLHGGVALGKYPTRSVPAGVYIDGEGAAKLLIWKLGGDFMRGEGRDWRKSF
jgi:hypothetical protein